MQDLSSKLPSDPLTALAPTSQAGGNMSSDNKWGMSAPGSPPTDPVQPASEQGDPKITASDGPAVIMGGRDRRPRSYNPPAPSWSKPS